MRYLASRRRRRSYTTGAGFRFWGPYRLDTVMGLWRQTEIAGEAGKEVDETRSNAKGARISRRCKRQRGGPQGVGRGVPFPLGRGLGRGNVTFDAFWRIIFTLCQQN